MKEAAGEANLTVVAIILIAVVVAVATPLIRSLMRTSAFRSCCTDAGSIWRNGHCRFAPGSSDDSEMAQQETYEQCLVNAGYTEDNILEMDE